MRVLVTGGGGFLGSAIVRRLLARGNRVRVIGRRHYAALEGLGAEGVVSDLSVDDPTLVEAFEGVDAVIHTAAMAGIWGPRDAFYAINVDGTRRVLEATLQAGVDRLVYTSSPSATFDGGSAEGVTEAEAPYPSRFQAVYPQTKAEAEALVLAADGERLSTVAIRPHLIWGPGDPHILPRLIEKNRQGRLAVVGDGSNRVGITFVENAAAAHLQALDALAPKAACAGKAYFVTDPEPVVLWDWIGALLADLGEPAIRRRVPLPVARGVGRVLEILWGVFGLSGEPPMTRFAASQLGTSHYFDLSAARADFGLAPIVDAGAAWAVTLEDLRQRYPR